MANFNIVRFTYYDGAEGMELNMAIGEENKIDGRVVMISYRDLKLGYILTALLHFFYILLNKEGTLSYCGSRVWTTDRIPKLRVVAYLRE